jgi:hypothetical protein
MSESTLELQSDVLYVAEIVCNVDRNPLGCELEINGRRLGVESLLTQLRTFEGWKMDIRIHE